MNKWLLYILAGILVITASISTFFDLQQRNAINTLSDNIEGSFTSVQQDIATLQEDVGDVGEKVSDVDDDISTINSVLNDLSGNLDAQQNTLDGIAGQLEDIQEGINANELDMESMQDNINSLGASISALQSQANVIREDITALQAHDQALKEAVEKVKPTVVLVQTLIPNVGYASGSGFVVDAKGYVVTNYHVVEGGSDITVFFNNGDSFRAHLVEADQDRDVAVIKLDSSRSDFPVVSLGASSDSRIGEEVLAVGYPFIAEWPVFTRGIISGKARIYGFDWLQLDAAVNHGNSGGPLVNIKGEVIGINTLGWIDYDIEGFSLAIPIDQVKAFIQGAVEE